MDCLYFSEFLYLFYRIICIRVACPNLTSYIIERSGNQSSNQEEVYFFHTLEIIKQTFIFYKKHIQNEPMMMPLYSMRT